VTQAQRATTAVAVLVAAVAAIAWWLLGDLSERGGEDVVLKLSQSVGVARVIGIAGCVAVAVLARPVAREIRADGPPAVRLAIAVVLSGAFAGFTLRVVSGRTNGANIGAGLLVFVVPMFAAWLLVAWRQYARHASAPNRFAVRQLVADATSLIARDAPRDAALTQLRGSADRATLEAAVSEAQTSLTWALVSRTRRNVWLLLRDAAGRPDRPI
jgi:hypothetical protein